MKRLNVRVLVTNVSSTPTVFLTVNVIGISYTYTDISISNVVESRFTSVF